MFIWQCPASYSPYKDRCFKLDNEELDWYTARSRCQSNGADLAIISDQDTNDFIRALHLNDIGNYVLSFRVKINTYMNITFLIDVLIDNPQRST